MTKCPLVLGMVCAAGLVAQSAAPVTFYKDILAILQKNCQSCHRAGQITPKPFLTRQQVRPWAKAMKAAVATRKMPPWFADPQVSHFLNDRALQPGNIDTVAKWVDNGAVEGHAKDAPPPALWAKGWQIKPDIVVEGPTKEVPAHPKNDVIEWISVTVPTGFKEDTWITSVPIQPEHPAVAHHICLGFNAHTPDIEYFKPVWLDKQPDEEGSALPGKGPTFGPATPGGRFRNMAEDCYLPGNRSATTAISKPPSWFPPAARSR